MKAIEDDKDPYISCKCTMSIGTKGGGLMFPSTAAVILLWVTPLQLFSTQADVRLLLINSRVLQLLTYHRHAYCQLLPPGRQRWHWTTVQTQSGGVSIHYILSPILVITSKVRCVIVVGIWVLLDRGRAGTDSPITRWGDYDGNLIEAGKKSLHQGST